jgi:fibronectin-binding autotransporter adhesin
MGHREQLVRGDDTQFHRNGNGLAFGTLPPGFTTSDLLLATSQAGKIDLLVSATGFTDQFWDGTTTVGNGTIEGGSGVWNNTTTNWTNADAKTNAPWNKGFAIFGGAAGTVTLGDNINLIGLQFMTDGYLIYAPGSQTLIASPGSIIRVDSEVTATIEAPIVDTKGIRRLLSQRRSLWRIQHLRYQSSRVRRYRHWKHGWPGMERIC